MSWVENYDDDRFMGPSVTCGFGRFKTPDTETNLWLECDFPGGCQSFWNVLFCDDVTWEQAAQALMDDGWRYLPDHKHHCPAHSGDVIDAELVPLALEQ
jgi:hypothetical protein